jgi:hypothetical protein
MSTNKDPVTESFITFALCVGQTRIDAPGYAKLPGDAKRRAVIVALAEMSAALVQLGKLAGVEPEDIAATIKDTWSDTPDVPDIPAGLLS